MRRLLIAACLMAASCGSGPTSGTTTTLTPETATSEKVAHIVEAVRIDGVWVFQQEPGEPGEVSLTAAQGGVAEIRDQCLYVNEAIVVWQKEQIDQAAQVIADIQAGEEPQLRIGGGGISLKEGASPEDIPSAISERCHTSELWYQSS